MKGLKVKLKRKKKNNLGAITRTAMQVGRQRTNNQRKPPVGLYYLGFRIKKICIAINVLTYL